MIVTTISYKRLINLGNYENVAVEMTAQITGEDPVPPAFEELREEVHAACRTLLADHVDHTWRWPDLFPPNKPAGGQS